MEPNVYRRLIESDISHGAFRLWHLLRDRSDRESQTFIGYEFISEKIHCNQDSIPGWLDQLKKGRWLKVEKMGEKNLYTVLDGTPKPHPIKGVITPEREGDTENDIPPKQGVRHPQKRGGGSPLKQGV